MEEKLLYYNGVMWFWSNVDLLKYLMAFNLPELPYSKDQFPNQISV